MRLLLDSNILIPVLRQKMDAMEAGMADAIADSSNEIFASVASLWEIAIKVRLNKLDVKIELEDIPEFLRENGIGLIVIDATHALYDLKISPDTRDPFDRLLLAQCQIENMRLVTVDRALADHPLVWRA
jgi:PIN domain nuclease of toxin-antitoxin system